MLYGTLHCLINMLLALDGMGGGKSNTDGQSAGLYTPHSAYIHVCILMSGQWFKLVIAVCLSVQHLKGGALPDKYILC